MYMIIQVFFNLGWAVVVLNKNDTLDVSLMPQSHHTPGTLMGFFPGCSRAVLNKNRMSTHGARTAPYEFYFPVRGP